MPPVGIAVTPQSSSTSATAACFTRFRSITLRQAGALNTRREITPCNENHLFADPDISSSRPRPKRYQKSTSLKTSLQAACGLCVLQELLIERTRGHNSMSSIQDHRMEPSAAACISPLAAMGVSAFSTRLLLRGIVGSFL